MQDRLQKSSPTSYPFIRPFIGFILPCASIVGAEIICGCVDYFFLGDLYTYIYIYIYNILRNCEFFDDAGLRIFGQDHKGAPLILGNISKDGPQIPAGKTILSHILFKVGFTYQVIQSDLFIPCWRPLNHLKGSLNHLKKVTKNCQVCNWKTNNPKTKDSGGIL